MFPAEWHCCWVPRERSAWVVRQQWTWVSAFSSSWVRSKLVGYPQSAVAHGLVGEWEARARTRQEGMEVIHHIIYPRFSFLDQPNFTEDRDFSPDFGFSISNIRCSEVSYFSLTYPIQECSYAFLKYQKFCCVESPEGLKKACTTFSLRLKLLFLAFKLAETNQLFT
jgi:hypothetical protein